MFTVATHGLCYLWWWRHQMEIFSALLAICAGHLPVAGEFSAQRPVTRSFDVIFDMRLTKRLGKQWWGGWFETLSYPLWRHCNVTQTTWYNWISIFIILFIQQSICFAMDKTRIGQIKALFKWKYSGDVSPWILGPGQSRTITHMLAVRRCLKWKCGSLARISNVENPGERLSRQK